MKKKEMICKTCVQLSSCKEGKKNIKNVCPLWSLDYKLLETPTRDPNNEAWD